jgi:hypothetical protein
MDIVITTSERDVVEDRIDDIRQALEDINLFVGEIVVLDREP